MQLLADGSYAFCDQVDIPGEGAGYFTFAEGWLIEVVAAESGDYYFYSDGLEVRPVSRRFGVYYPPFSLIRAFSKDFRGQVFGIGSTVKAAGLPNTPVMFETKRSEPFSDVAEAIEVFTASTHQQNIEINTRPSLLSLKCKRMIDENYRIYPSIAKIAARIGVSHEHLSRQFKRDHGLSPSDYLHQLRAANATYRLSAGEEIIDIAGEVGYNDLSRFYKQFRKQYGTSPGRCRAEKF